MDPTMIGAIGIVCLVLAILSGFHIFLSLGLVGAIGLFAVGGMPAIAEIKTTYFSFTHLYHFTCLPMFILMGSFAMGAGIGQDAFSAATKWVGRIRGGLAHATVLAAALFGAATGSSSASGALFARLALPQMIQVGYDKKMAASCVAIAGTLAIMIPPSGLVIIYAILTDQNIGELLIAGVIPGFVFAGILILTTYIWVRIDPKLAPLSTEIIPVTEKLYSLRYVGPLGILILAIIGGLLYGVYTPTEGGAVGAILTLLISVIRNRGFRNLNLLHSLKEATRTSIMVFMIITSAIVFAKFMALSGVVDVIANGIIGLAVNRYVVWLIIIMLYLFLGMIVDPPSMLAISLPITLPVMTSLGFDPVWFGVQAILLSEIGLITPPVGVNCFVVAGAAPKGLVTLNDVFAGIVPYVVAGLVMVVILTVFPDLALYLPRSMGMSK